MMGALEAINGWKMYIAGFALIGLGIYEMTQGRDDSGMTHIAAGLGAIGVGHKLDKNTEAVKALGAVQPPPA